MRAAQLRPLRAPVRACGCFATELLCSATQLAFRRGDRPALPRVALDRLPHRAGETLVEALADVMVVGAVEQLHVERDARGLAHRVEPVLDQLGVPFAEAFLGELGLPNQIRPSGDVQGNPRKGLVHRRIGSAITPDPGLFAQRLRNRLTQRDRRILGGVVLVDVEVALDLHRHVDQRVAAELLHHVIKKADASRNVIGAGPVEIDGNGDLRLGGVAVYRAGAPRHWGGSAGHVGAIVRFARMTSMTGTVPAPRVSTVNPA